MQYNACINNTLQNCEDQQLSYINCITYIQLQSQTKMKILHIALYNSKGERKKGKETESKRVGLENFMDEEDIE